VEEHKDQGASLKLISIFARVVVKNFLLFPYQMVKHYSILISHCLIALVLLLGGCSASKPGSTTYQDYEDKETGWSTRFPSSWEIVPDAEAALTEGHGGRKLEATVNRKVDMTHKRLLWIRNGKMNSFTSNKMNFDFSTADAYDANMLKINDIMVKTQKHQGIKLDYRHGTMIIDGLEFKTFEITVYSKETGRVAGYQLVCTRYISERIGLMLNINYTNDKNKQILMDMLTSSKLVIRN
jgi:hypothetical protein